MVDKLKVVRLKMFYVIHLYLKTQIFLQLCSNKMFIFILKAKANILKVTNDQILG